MDEFDFSTLAVHAGEEPDPESGAMRLPIDMATTFKLPPFGPGLMDAVMLDSPQPPQGSTLWWSPRHVEGKEETKTTGTIEEQ